VVPAAGGTVSAAAFIFFFMKAHLPQITNVYMHAYLWIIWRAVACPEGLFEPKKHGSTP
jgi:hypothetical protein